MAQWAFTTNHGLVLVYIGKPPRDGPKRHGSERSPVLSRVHAVESQF